MYKTMSDGYRYMGFADPDEADLETFLWIIRRRVWMRLYHNSYLIYVEIFKNKIIS